MDNIIEPSDSFDFSTITLAHPASTQGGGYFTKIEHNKKPLYIQTTKSLTRQGFVKTGKKYYCDLMFDKNSETLIHWMENLEEKCHQLIYEKKDAWFQGNLEASDIETAFNPIIRVYKSGKYYLLRTNIKNNKDDIPAVKIYNEKEIPLTMADITPETELISILDIQGIKFTSRNFQIEIDLKQVMVLDNEPIFDSCLIKPNKRVEKPLDEMPPTPVTQVLSAMDTLIDKTTDPLEELSSADFIADMPAAEKEDAVNIEFEDLMEDIQENNTDVLKEVHTEDLTVDKADESITLKKPNQVYFELYKEARNKAKLAKKNALLAFLEAKNIKKTYMIENINDSDSDIDAEIDDVSESELEGL